MKHDIDITLFNPEIPQNTGNIVRTCKATNTPLRLVKPLGFHFSDKQLRRAGLDYWEDVQIEICSIVDFEFVFRKERKTNLYLYQQDRSLILGR